MVVVLLLVPVAATYSAGIVDLRIPEVYIEGPLLYEIRDGVRKKA